MKLIVRLKVTEKYTSNITVSWFVFKNLQDKELWLEDLKDKRKPGNSYSYKDFDPTSLRNLATEEFRYISFQDFLKILSIVQCQ